MIQRHRLEEAAYRGERFAEGFDSLQPGGPREGHDLKGNNDLLTLTRPDVIAQVHADYLDAGADLVETNTFNATAIRQADYHLPHLVRELNAEGARLARECCDAAGDTTPGTPTIVMGRPGPTSPPAPIPTAPTNPGFPHPHH